MDCIPDAPGAAAPPLRRPAEDIPRQSEAGFFLDMDIGKNRRNEFLIRRRGALRGSGTIPISQIFE
jgi:hypothetical protein